MSAMSSVRTVVLASFKRIMRARELAFKGDTEMLAGSRQAIREQYQSVTAVRDAEHLKELISGADEAADMLKHQLVQGVRTGEGSYTLNTDARHATSADSIPNIEPPR